jgi:hypothetical protein
MSEHLEHRPSPPVEEKRYKETREARDAIHPSIQQAWEAFHGTPVLSDQFRKEIAPHLPVLDPLAKDVASVHAKAAAAVKKSVESRGAGTFEQVAALNATMIQQQRIKQEGDPKLRADVTTTRTTMMREVVWRMLPRAIDRSLRTMDRYAALRQRFPGVPVNTRLEQEAVRHMQRLNTAMRWRTMIGWLNRGIGAGVTSIMFTSARKGLMDQQPAYATVVEQLIKERAADDITHQETLGAEGKKRIAAIREDSQSFLKDFSANGKRLMDVLARPGATATEVQAAADAVENDATYVLIETLNASPDPAFDVYRDFLNRALDWHAEESRKLSLVASTPEIEKRLKELRSTRDEILKEQGVLFSEAGRTYLDELMATTVPEARLKFEGDADVKVDAKRSAENESQLRKALNSQQDHLITGFRSHFSAVLEGDGKSAGLLSATMDLRMADIWTAGGGRQKFVQMLDFLVQTRAWLRPGTIPRLFLGTAEESNEKFRQEAMDPILIAMGFPPGFHINDEAAWKALTPEQRKVIEERGRSVLGNITRLGPSLRAAMQRLQGNIAVLQAIRSRAPFDSLQGVQPDPTWLARETIDEAAIKSLPNPCTTAADRAKLLAAYLVLYRDMRGNWDTYMKVLNEMSEANRKVLETHIETTVAGEEGARKTRPDWIGWLIFGGVIGGAWIYGGRGGFAPTAGYGWRDARRLVNAPARVGVNAWSGVRWLFGRRAPLAEAAETVRTSAEILKEARDLSTTFMTEVRAATAGTAVEARALGAQLRAQELFADLGILEQELIAAGRTSELATLRAMRLRLMNDYLNHVIPILSGRNPSLAQQFRLFQESLAGENGGRVLEAIWQAHLTESRVTKIRLLTEAGIPPQIVHRLLDAGVAGTEISTTVSPAMLNRLAEAAGTTVEASPYFSRLAGLASDADRAAIIRLSRTSPNTAAAFAGLNASEAQALAARLATAEEGAFGATTVLGRTVALIEGGRLNPQQAANVLRLLAEGENGALRGIVGLAEESRAAILGLERAEMLRVLRLCQESAPLRAALNGVRDVQGMRTIARLLEQGGEPLAAALRAMSAESRGTELARLIAFMADGTQATEHALMLQRLSTAGRLTEQASLLRRVGVVLEMGAGNVVRMAGRGVHFLGRVLGPVAVAIECWMFIDTLGTGIENHNLSTNVTSMLRTRLLRPIRGEDGRERPSRFTEQVVDGQTHFIYRNDAGEELCRVNATELERRLVAAVGIDAARSINSLAGVVSAVSFFFGPIGMGVGAIIMVANFIVNAHLRNEDALMLEQLLADESQGGLPPELLVLLPLTQLRRLHDYREQEEFGYFISLRNLAVRRLSSRMSIAPDAIFKRLMSGESVAPDVLKAGLEVWSELQGPLAASLFNPVYREIQTMVPTQLVAGWNQDAVRAIWEDRVLILQTFQTFLPELGVFRSIFSNEDMTECRQAMQRTASYYVRHRLTQVLRQSEDRQSRHEKASSALAKELSVDLGAFTRAPGEDIDYTPTASIIKALLTRPGAELGWRALAGIPETTAKGTPDLSRVTTAGIVEALEGMRLDDEVLPALVTVGSFTPEQRTHVVRVLQSLPNNAQRGAILRRLVNPPLIVRETLLKQFAAACEGGLLTQTEQRGLQMLIDRTANAAPAGLQYTIRQLVALNEAHIAPPGLLAPPRFNTATNRWDIGFTRADVEQASNERSIPPESRYEGLDSATALYFHSLGIQPARIGFVIEDRTLQRRVVGNDQPGQMGWTTRNGGVDVFFFLNEGRLYWASASGPMQPVGEAYWTVEQVLKNPNLRTQNDMSRTLAQLQERLQVLPIAAAEDIERGGVSFLRLQGARTETVAGQRRYTLESGAATIHFACFGGHWFMSTPSTPLWERCPQAMSYDPNDDTRYVLRVARQLRLTEERFDPDFIFTSFLRESAQKNAKERNRVAFFAAPGNPDVRRWATGDATMEVAVFNYWSERPSPSDPSIPLRENPSWDTFEFRRSPHGHWEIRLVATSARPERLIGAIDPMVQWQPLDAMIAYLANPYALEIGSARFGNARNLTFRGALAELQSIRAQLESLQKSSVKSAMEYSPENLWANDMVRFGFNDLPPDQRVQSLYVGGFPNTPIRQEVFGDDPRAPTVLEYFPIESGQKIYGDVMRQLAQRALPGYQSMLKETADGRSYLGGYPQILQFRTYQFERDGVPYEAVECAIINGTSEGAIGAITVHTALRPRRPNAAFVMLPARNTSPTEFYGRAGFHQWSADMQKEVQGNLKLRTEGESKAKLDKLDRSISFTERLYCAMHFTGPVLIERTAMHSLYARRDGDNLVMVWLNNAGAVQSYRVIRVFGGRAVTPLPSDEATREHAEQMVNAMQAPPGSAVFNLTKRQQQDVKILEGVMKSAPPSREYVAGAAEKELADAEAAAKEVRSKMEIESKAVVKKTGEASEKTRGDARTLADSLQKSAEAQGKVLIEEAEKSGDKAAIAEARDQAEKLTSRAIAEGKQLVAEAEKQAAEIDAKGRESALQLLAKAEKEEKEIMEKGGRAQADLKLVGSLLNAPPQERLDRFVSSSLNSTLITIDGSPSRFQGGDEAVLRPRLSDGIRKAYEAYIAPRPGFPPRTDTLQNRQVLFNAIFHVLHPQTSDPINANRFQRIFPDNVDLAVFEVQNMLNAPH